MSDSKDVPTAEEREEQIISFAKKIDETVFEGTAASEVLDVCRFTEDHFLRIFQSLSSKYGI